MPSTTETRNDWHPEPGPWSRADLVALLVWTAIVCGFFWDVVTLRRALFYFDITELNLPYRDYLADEWKAGRFSFWMPSLFCGMPLFSESQAGYFHPFKPLFYPWMETWKAFGLDCVLSVWLTGAATYGWLRRHTRPAASLTGAVVFGLGGFTWAHFIHTSMLNALPSVPLAFWALEWAWSGRGARASALGGLALACQIFAGHLQDFLLTCLGLGVYALYRTATERRWPDRLRALGLALAIVLFGVAFSAVQWIPSKELLDRSPRAGGLTWDELTYGSWHPELLPTLLVREAYGTRARDTDWMDGFYPYHEMNAYLGVLALALAMIGLCARRDRWAAFWILFAALGGLLMLGRYTILLDLAPRIPVLGSSRIPVRFHLWVSLAVAALAAVGADRLARPGPIRAVWPFGVLLGLLLLSMPILYHVYEPVWTRPNAWPLAYHQDRYRWLSQELILSTSRSLLLAITGAALVLSAARHEPLRRRLVPLLPLVIAAELLGAHWQDVPTIEPAYWTSPPESARLILSDPDRQRVSGIGRFSAGEPGYASFPIDFLKARDTLAWSLPPVFGLDSSSGATPMIPRRWKDFFDTLKTPHVADELAGVRYLLTGYPGQIAGWPPAREAGTAYIFQNPRVLPRVRLAGRPVYASDREDALALLGRLGAKARERLVVEDPTRPLPADATASGEARIVSEVPDRLVVSTRSDGPSYLFLADSFDPGWSATIDGQPAPIRPAYLTFRAVFLPPGEHRVEFRYLPAGFRTGLGISLASLFIALATFLTRSPGRDLRSEHDRLAWPSSWPLGLLGLCLLIILVSSVIPPPPSAFARWDVTTHKFTWGAGLEAMQRAPMVQGR